MQDYHVPGSRQRTQNIEEDFLQLEIMHIKDTYVTTVRHEQRSSWENVANEPAPWSERLFTEEQVTIFIPTRFLADNWRAHNIILSRTYVGLLGMAAWVPLIWLASVVC